MSSLIDQDVVCRVPIGERRLGPAHPDRLLTAVKDDLREIWLPPVYGRVLVENFEHLIEVQLGGDVLDAPPRAAWLASTFAPGQKLRIRAHEDLAIRYVVLSSANPIEDSANQGAHARQLYSPSETVTIDTAGGFESGGLPTGWSSSGSCYWQVKRALTCPDSLFSDQPDQYSPHAVWGSYYAASMGGASGCRKGNVATCVFPIVGQDTSDTTILYSKSFDPYPYASIRLAFKYNIPYFGDNDDFFEYGMAVDGVEYHWELVRAPTGSCGNGLCLQAGWSARNVTYNVDWTGSTRIYFKFDSDWNAASSGAYLDEVVVSGGACGPTITAPAAGDKMYIGSTYPIEWVAGGTLCGSSVKIEANGVPYGRLTIEASTANDGSHYWTIPSSFPEGSQWWVYVTDTSNSWWRSVGPLSILKRECTLTCSATAGNNGQVGQNVSFNASVNASNCSGSVSYYWEFGDGGSSGSQNTTHAYATGGTYNWSMTASVDGKQCRKTGSVTIAEPLVCAISCTASGPSGGETGQALGFTSSSNPSNCSGAVSYHWEFGDGGSSASQNPSHVYSSSGTYYWTMTASVDGKQCQKTGSVSITSPAVCSLSCTASGPSGGETGQSLGFTSSSNPSNCSGSVSYYWEFGDGGSSASQNPSHAYSSNGTYYWTMTASVDGKQCQRTGSVTISATPVCSVGCTASGPSGGQTGQSLPFTSSASTSHCSGSVSYYWDFGDGGSSGSQNPSHAYSSNGTYYWTLTASVDGKQCQRTGSVTISTTPVCSIGCTASGPSGGHAGQSLPFTSSANPSNCSGPVSYYWDFGDGGSSSSQNPSHAYSSNGTYYWTLTASVDGKQCQRTGSVTISTTPVCSIVCTASGPGSGQVGQGLSFTASATPSNCGGASVQYFWEFGDGSTSATQNPTHTYSYAGSYVWTLTASAGGTQCQRSGAIAVGATTSYTLSITGAGSGVGRVSGTGIDCTVERGAATGSCVATYSAGTPVVLSALASGGSTFGGWGGACSGSGSCTVVMNGSKNVSAAFSSSSSGVSLSISGGGTGQGTVRGTGINCTIVAGDASGACVADFPSGTNVTLMATAAGGSVFSGWGGACSGTGTCVVTLSSSTAVSASFAPEGGGGGGGCVPDSSNLCLLNGRFRVQAAYRDYAGNVGHGQAVPLTSDTGYFWFFSPSNVEAIVKMVSFCSGSSGNVGVYAGGMTDVEIKITVTDMTTGVQREYVNPLGTPFRLVRDGSFSCSAAREERASLEDHGPIAQPSANAPAPQENLASCVPDDRTLCLMNNRFQVQADYRDYSGRTDTARAVRLTSDTGYFWFFGSANVEAMVKAVSFCTPCLISPCPPQGNVGLYAAGLTDLGVTIHVTDLATGARRDYTNALGSPFQLVRDGGYSCGSARPDN